MGRIRELEKRVEELESKVKDAEDDRKSEKEISIRRQVEAHEYCRKVAASAEDDRHLLELASRCTKRIHQAYVQMAETAFNRDAWEEDRAIKSAGMTPCQTCRTLGSFGPPIDRIGRR